MHPPARVLILVSLVCASLAACDVPTVAPLLDPVAEGSWREGLPEPVPAACGAIPALEAAFVPIEQDTWALAGALDAVSHFEGACGGEGPDRALHFTAPVAGTWLFTYDGRFTGFPGVLQLLRDCSPDAESLACGAPVSVVLAAGEEVVLVADAGYRPTCADDPFAPGCGEMPAAPGAPFVLLARRSDAPETPRVTAVRARQYAHSNETTVVRVEFTDANGDIDRIRIRPYTADGHYVFGHVPDMDSLRPAGGVLGLGMGSATFELRLDGGAVRVEVSAVDALGAESPWVSQAIEFWPGLAHGAPCDPNLIGRLVECAGNNACTASPEVGAVCLPNRAPVIDFARFVGSPGGLVGEVTVHDPDRDAYEAVVSLLEQPGGEPLVLAPDGVTTAVLRKRDGVWNEALQDSVWSVDAPGTVPVPRTATHVRLMVTDAGGAVASAEFPLEPWRDLEHGEACWRDGRLGRCADGLDCLVEFPWRGIPTGECLDAAPPQVIGGQAILAPDGRLTIVVDGTLGRDSTLYIVRVEALADRDGAAIGIHPDPDARRLYDAARLDLVEGVDATVFHLVQPVPAHVIAEPERLGALVDDPTGATIRLVVSDTFDQRSATAELPIVSQSTRAPGEACDPAGLLDRCADGALCGPLTATCP